MSRAAIDTARILVAKRQFGKAIALLESSYEVYKESFDYYLLLANACLYAGDAGNANHYYQMARRIKLTDVNLLLGQAALFLRRGDTDRAIQYYLDVLDNEPENKIAKEAMNFIREQGNYENIVKWVDTGKISRFYPPIGFNYSEVLKIGISVLCGIAAAVVLLFCLNFSDNDSGQKRADLTDYALTVEEQKNPQEADLSGGVYRYILTPKQINQAYEDARQYFQDYRDNSARVEINRLLNSNAASSIKQKANLLLTYFEEPGFDTLTDNFNYEDVARDPVLYLGCWVNWSGRITNALRQEESYKCDLLVGYENLERVDGIVPLYFSIAPEPEIEGDRPVKVLAQIGIENSRITLNGRAVYQPVRKTE